MPAPKHPPMFRHFLRLLFLQSLWNYQTMQGNGFLFALIPYFRKRDDNQRKDLSRFHGFFNAHPYLASLAVGATLRREADGTPDNDDIQQFHNMLAGPLGLVGDSIFWSGWKPACAFLGVLLSVFYTGYSLGPLIAALVFLLLYNILHLRIRWWGLTTGWELSDQVLAALTSPTIKRLQWLVPVIGALILGLTSGMILARATSLSAAVTGAVIAGGVWSWIGTKLRLPILLIVTIPLAVVLIVGCIFNL